MNYIELSESELAEDKISFIDRFLQLLSYIRQEHGDELRDEDIVTIQQLSDRLYDSSLSSDSDNLLMLCNDLENFLTITNLGFWSDELLQIHDMRTELSSYQKESRTLNVLSEASTPRPVFWSSERNPEPIHGILKRAELEFVRDYLLKQKDKELRNNV